MRREIGLYQHVALHRTATGTPRHLREQGIQAFRRAKIRAVEQVVGIDHGHQRQVGEVMAFGENLRADENIHFACFDALAHAAPRAARACAVAVDAQYARLRKALGQCGFDALRALPYR